jgi:pimeloyl-ACP methyl ester carboxylesterase
LLHPGLLRGLILIDPVIQTENPSKIYAPASTYRRDRWSSRQDAVERFSKSKFYQAWDSRVLSQWNQYGLRELPTELYPEEVNQSDPPVTLKTPVSQEVFSYLRPKYYGSPSLLPEKNRLMYGDMHPEDREPDYDFYRPEPAELFRKLPELKPPVHYIFGKNSELATPLLRQKKLETTGTGVGGNGGWKEGQVHETVLDCGHLVPMEKTTESADVAASFTATELDKWEEFTKEWQSQWRSKSRRDRVGIDEEWRAKIGPRQSKTK